MADLSFLLARPGKVPQIGRESGKPMPNGISVYRTPRSPYGRSFRFVMHERGHAIAALQVMQPVSMPAVIANVWVERDRRREGIASMLFDYAQIMLGPIQHSGHLSEDGRAWAAAKSNPAIPDQIQQLMPAIVQAAQRVYRGWQQDPEGHDEELGTGGICHLISEEIVGIADAAGITCTSVSSTHEVHVYTVLRLPRLGVWMVDIHPNVYERGGGYTWRKIPDVQFSEQDITVELLDRDPGAFERYVDE